MGLFPVSLPRSEDATGRCLPSGTASLALLSFLLALLVFFLFFCLFLATHFNC